MENLTGKVYRIDRELFCLVKVPDSKGRIGYMPVSLANLKDRWEDPVLPGKILLTLQNEDEPARYVGTLRGVNITSGLALVQNFPSSADYYTNVVFYTAGADIFCPVMFQNSKFRMFYALISVSLMGRCVGVRQSISIHQELRQQYGVLGHIPRGVDMSCFIEPLIRREQ